METALIGRTSRSPEHQSTSDEFFARHVHILQPAFRVCGSRAGTFTFTRMGKAIAIRVAKGPAMQWPSMRARLTRRRWWLWQATCECQWPESYSCSKYEGRVVLFPSKKETS